jgi:hypothetical protein
VDQERFIWVGETKVAERTGEPGRDTVAGGEDTDSFGVAEASGDAGLIPTEFIA